MALFEQGHLIPFCRVWLFVFCAFGMAHLCACLCFLAGQKKKDGVTGVHSRGSRGRTLFCQTPGDTKPACA